MALPSRPFKNVDLQLGMEIKILEKSMHMVEKSKSGLCSPCTFGIRFISICFRVALNQEGFFMTSRLVCFNE